MHLRLFEQSNHLNIHIILRAKDYLKTSPRAKIWVSGDEATQQIVTSSRKLTPFTLKTFYGSHYGIPSSKPADVDALFESIEELQIKCSICWEPLNASSEITKLCCNHTFHAKCMANWITTKGLADANCPLCRASYI